MIRLRMLAGAAAATVIAGSAPGPLRAQTVVPLTATDGLTLVGVTAAADRYRGRPAVRVTTSPDADRTIGGLALLDGFDFADGTIDVLVAGTVAPGADTSARGFVGVTFHTSPDASRFENIYLRMANGRADDQLRRNHAVQYQSSPGDPWFKLRRESPGQFEAYADLDLGAWTRMRVVVEGTRARLFINGAAQPSLIVNHLKSGDRHGRIGLWIGPGTRAYFSHLEVTPASP